MKPRLSFDQILYLIVAAPAIFFGWFVITGALFVPALMILAKRLKRVGINLFAAFESVGGDDNVAMILGLVIAFIGSAVMSRKTIRNTWPAQKPSRSNESDSNSLMEPK